jgi:hypothetical protein
MGTEIIAVLTLAVLRIGVPLLLIFAVSYAAYRWLGNEKQTRPTIAPPATIGGRAPMATLLSTNLHCWDAKGCTAEMKALCPATARPELPCWLAVQMKTGHLTKNCPDCDFYERPVIRA